MTSSKIHMVIIPLAAFLLTFVPSCDDVVPVVNPVPDPQQPADTSAIADTLVTVDSLDKTDTLDEIIGSIEFSDIPVVFGASESPDSTDARHGKTRAVISTEDLITANGKFRFSATYHFEYKGVNKTFSYDNRLATNGGDIESPFKPDNTGVSDKLIYWPLYGDFNYFAVWPVSYDIEGTADSYSINVGTSSSPFNCNDDVVVARNCGISLTSATDGKIPVVFRHILCGIKISAISNIPATDKVTIDRLSFTVPCCGTYTFGTASGTSRDGVWSIPDNTREVVVENWQIDSTPASRDIVFLPGYCAISMDYTYQGKSYLEHYSWNGNCSSLKEGENCQYQFTFNEKGKLIVGEAFENLGYEEIPE